MLPPVYDRSPSLEIRGLEPRSGASTQLVHGTNAHHASILQTVDNVWCIHQPLSSLVGQHLQIEQLHKVHQSMCDLHPSTMYSSPSSRIWQACWPQICILWSQRQLNASDGPWQVGLFVSVHRIRVRRMCDAQLSWLSKYVTIFHNCTKRGRTSSYHNKGKHAASSCRALQIVAGCLHCDCFCWSQLTQTRPKTCSSHVQALQATGDMLKDRKT